VLIRLLVRSVETIVFANTSLLDIHLLVVTVFLIQAVKLVNHVLAHGHFWLLLAREHL
jgi:hypothetical protein